MDCAKSNDTNSVEELAALRTQLLTLGRTEGQLNELKDRALDSTSNVESSIMELLELWQQIFQDTFQQYHRISTRLAQNEDTASALNLWHDYLMHVQTFLSETLPDDYLCLNEYRNLCEVHQNVLTSQQSILSAKTDGISHIDSNLVCRFDQLSALHSETLQRIVSRHNEIELRIKLWNQYKNDLSNLLIWLKEKEREKSHLQLRYIHLQRIPHNLQVIQNMLVQMEQAEQRCSDLRSNQGLIIKFSNNSALITSMRMEIGAISTRIDNLRASLETWKDFLQRISDSTATFNQKVIQLQSQFQKTQQTINNVSKDIPNNVSKIKNRLDELRHLRIHINNLTPELESASVIQEELKECLNPSNIKNIRHTIHGLWQQQADLDQQLTQLITYIDDRLTTSHIFSEKYERFLKWMGETERRLDNESNCLLFDSDELLRRLEKDFQSEFSLREYEKEWLLSTGRELLSFYATPNESDKSNRVEIRTKLDTVVDGWERLKTLSISRSNKILELKMTIIRLEERITAIRSWLHNIAMELNKPIAFESTSSDAYEKVILENETLQRKIETESGNVAEVLNLCEMVLSDMDMWKSHVDTSALSTAVETLDRRWKHICKASVERKQRIHLIWSLLMDSLESKSAKELASWVDIQERDLYELEHGIDTLTKNQTEQRINDLKKKIKEIERYQPKINSLALSYSKLVKTNGIDPINIQQLANPCKIWLMRCDGLLSRALDIVGILNEDIQLHEKFINLHGKSVVTLARLDVDLTKTEHLEKASPEEKLRSLHILEHELKLCENDLAAADQLGLVIMQKSDANGVDNVQTMIDEYQLLWKDITTRILTIKITLKSQIAQSKHAEDTTVYRSETDSAVQVNTIPSLNRTTSITPKDAYIHELEAALQECQENLNELEKQINNPQRKPGSQVVQKLCSNCQSSVELLRHLSNILITECFCSNDEAAVEKVASISSRYEELITTWKSREQQFENRYFYKFLFIFFHAKFCFWIMGFISFHFFFQISALCDFFSITFSITSCSRLL